MRVRECERDDRAPFWLVSTDARGRTKLPAAIQPENQIYAVEKEPDGTLVLHPIKPKSFSGSDPCPTR